ncbi:uncharacterized protein E0L32_002877 [Thyridium curvatum]|uniref:RCC1-like domain-containing protein n=1 Tax=Thyridium curvatum TaxID=1093900 RepID=A0A507BEN2_9PEZI|nr:uncharacterized protein E0L32_002877 [Thyridium curvatum]TPX17776.1 hypothetical protein E0L32_002877 [Thyridium curvatum]
MPSRKRKSEENHAHAGTEHTIRSIPIRGGRPAVQRDSSLNEAPTQGLTVLIFGTGDCGELGLGPVTKEVRRPRIMQSLNPENENSYRVVQLDTGGMHVVALTADNKIVTWGVNDKGALGRDTEWEGRLRDADVDMSDDDDSDDLNPVESTPTDIPADSFPPNTTFTQVAAGDNASFAITDTGLVYGWGTFLNTEGHEGFCFDANGSFIKLQRRPFLIPGLKDITSITCGANHALALDARGRIWAWGVGEQNQLGRRIMPRRVMESYVPHQVEVCRHGAKAIAAGSYHSFAVDKLDNVWGWGLNSFGQAGYAKYAGDPSNTFVPYPMKIPGLCGQGIKMVSGSAHHSAAVAQDGRCLVWGRLDGGQLGVKLSAEQLDDDSLVRRDERGRPRICLRPVTVSQVGQTSYVDCGSGHTVFVGSDGKARSSGFGTMYQLGLGSDDDVETAQLIFNKAVRDRVLTWAGTGGQFSMVAGPAWDTGSGTS